MAEAKPAAQKKRKAEEEETPAAKRTKPAEAEGTSKTLFVGGLPWSIDEDTLAVEFGAYGTVISARIITDRETGKSKG
jgi:nucleolin